MMGVLEQVYLRAGRDRTPLSVHFDLTYRCHQSCVHCYLPETWRRGEGSETELATPEVKHILDQLAAAGTFFLTFSGGEIFLRPDLLTLLEYARQLNFSVSLMTTGTIGPDDAQIRLIRDLGVEAVLVSLHSLDKNLHDRVTAIPGSWQKAWKTIGKCRAAGIQVVFNSQALGFNYQGIPAMKDYAAREGIPVRADGLLTVRWDGQPHPQGLALTPEEDRWLRRQIFGEEAREVMPPQTVWHDSNDGYCKAGFSSGYVSPRGEVWPCLEIPWSCGLLSKRGTDFGEIWKSSATLDFLRSVGVEDQKGSEPFCYYLRRKGIKPIAFN
jgi:MoaA/NifB/PqqE/SkfB family radical SAM enzyme